LEDHNIMKRSLAPLLAVVALAACSDAPQSRLETTSPTQAGVPQAPVFSKGDDGIDGDYIVVFKDDVADALGKADDKAQKHDSKMKFKYDKALKGYAATLSPAALAALQADPDVAYIEQDQVVTTTTTQTGATWGIDRVDQHNRPLSGTYTYTSTGTGVRAYIIDTGIQTSHSQFGGRASVAYDALGGNGQDCNGHGTHVAGTVGSATYGVAKSVLLNAVRVLDCSGSGTTSGVIAGINWVASHHISPAVANMSLGGGFSSALNSAVNSLASGGVFIAVAAGNSNANACNSSPSSAANATSVASSTSTDAKSSFSNYGSCVHLYAPGSSITSTWLNGGTNTISGTSMASPHVAGVAALYKSSFGDASFSTIRSWMTTNSTSGVITGNPSGTPNRLLFKSTL
jgi:subtilisin family serine protease